MILVTGATGIVGMQVVRDLVEKGYTVRAIRRKSSNVSWLADIDEKIEWIEADVVDLPSLEKAFKEVTHVIHCAAVVSFDNSNDQLMKKVNIEGTQNMLALSQKHFVKKFIHISSVAAIGRSSNNAFITEETKWTQSSLNTAYAVSKYQSELEVWRAQEEGLSTVILNPSVVIGPGPWINSSLNLFKHVKDGNPIYPVGSVNCVDVRDISLAALKLIESPIEAERFVLNSEMITYKEFFELIAKAMNKKAPRFKINPSLAIFAASILKPLKLLGVKTNITKEAVVLSQLNTMFSSEKAERILGIKFKPVQESVNWAYQQILSKGFEP
ncbi:MAG: SDR family NAD(P)-dependent oxidoreductase [Cyclobacteriaceae bacterium]|nr:SDR family NAD(P)-dependent oxidoreductase [Cyclobacteriaceae bacterium]